MMRTNSEALPLTLDFGMSMRPGHPEPETSGSSASSNATATSKNQRRASRLKRSHSESRKHANSPLPPLSVPQFTRTLPSVGMDSWVPPSVNLQPFELPSLTALSLRSSLTPMTSLSFRHSSLPRPELPLRTLGNLPRPNLSRKGTPSLI